MVKICTPFLNTLIIYICIFLQFFDSKEFRRKAILTVRLWKQRKNILIIKINDSTTMKSMNYETDEGQS